jgi:dienelactone hydrolase
MLHRYLLDQARQQFDARRRAIAAIKSTEDVARRQERLRASFLRSLGDMPVRTPLNPRVTGVLKRDGYRVEKVVFESRPNHHVTANLYLPESRPPVPGILLPCGHSDNGKAFEGYQRACILLVKNGMAVLCYDPIGQGERFQLLDQNGKPFIRGTTEHTMAGIGALLVGRQLASYRIWDGFRALDYLASRHEVDPSRLGCTGNSGGGTMTAYLMALDDRIAVASPSCYITSLERLFATIGPQDAEQNINGQVADGMEHADFVTMRAPRPTLLTVGTRDFFDIKGSWDTFREIKLIYGRLGFGERVDLFESDEEHGFTQPRRIATARWMRRWLLKQDDAVPEPKFPVATEAELQCTRTGQVQTDFKDLSVFDLNLLKVRELRIWRELNASLPAGLFRDELKNRLGLLTCTRKSARPRVAGSVPDDQLSIRKLIFDVEPGLALPALELTGRDSSSRGGPISVKFGVDWKAELAAVKQAGSSPGRIVLVDPRGIGETAPASRDGRNSPFGRDWKEAFVALSLARPLLGQRVTDILSILDGLEAELGAQEHPGFNVVGSGLAGPAVLHAAVLDDRGMIKSITIDRSLVSWSNILNLKVSRDQLGNVVPGALETYDLPDLAARLAPRPLSIRGAVDAQGNPVSQAELDQIYDACTKAYGPGASLELRAIQGLTPRR